jgi:hypothetical protein
MAVLDSMTLDPLKARQYSRVQDLHRHDFFVDFDCIRGPEDPHTRFSVWRCA